jgi:hypothetical protein
MPAFCVYLLTSYSLDFGDFVCIFLILTNYFAKLANNLASDRNYRASFERELVGKIIRLNTVKTFKVSKEFYF